MANTMVTTTRVVDDLLPAFVVGTALLELSNKMLAAEFSKGTDYGIGGTIQMRKYPRYFSETIDISDPNSSLSLSSQDIQQETETLTIENFTYGKTISLTAVESALQMRTQSAFNDYVINPMLNSIKEAVVSYIYEKMLYSVDYIVGSDSSLVNNYQTIADARALMRELQMPRPYGLVMSPIDMGAFSTAYVQNNFNRQSIDDIWNNGYVGMIDGFQTFEDEHIRLHTAGTASDNNSVTIETAMSDGDQTIDLTGLVIGETIKVGDILKVKLVGDGNDVYLVNPISGIEKHIIDNNLAQLAFVVIGDTTNTDYNSSTQTYTATSTAMKVRVSRPLRTSTTSDQYARVQTPTGTLVAGIGIEIIGNHRLNFAMSKGVAISFAAPPLPLLNQGAVTVRKAIDSISINCTTQDSLPTYSRNFVPAIQYGALIYPDYCVGIISGGTGS